MWKGCREKVLIFVSSWVAQFVENGLEGARMRRKRGRPMAIRLPNDLGHAGECEVVTRDGTVGQAIAVVISVDPERWCRPRWRRFLSRLP